MDEERLVWIFGSSRSGSTWLLRMLAALDGVVPVDDPHLGHHLGVWRPLPLAWAVGEDPPRLSTLLELKADEPGYFFSERHRDAWWEPLRALIGARFEAQAEGAGGARTFVVKEPGSHVAPLLAELFPTSKLVFLLRDGRDVVDSWLDAYSSGSWAIPGGAFAVREDDRVPLVRWLAAVWAYRSRAVRQAFETRDEEDRILIRYEELRRRTPEVLERICTAFELPTDRCEEIAARFRFEAAPRERRGRGKAIRAARPGSWRENLDRAEQLAMEEELGEALEEFGYEREHGLAERAAAS